MMNKTFLARVYRAVIRGVVRFGATQSEYVIL